MQVIARGVVGLKILRARRARSACLHPLNCFTANLYQPLRMADRHAIASPVGQPSMLYVYTSSRSGERPLLPPTGSSWIAVVRWRPRPSCLPHGDRPPGGGADRGSRRRGEREPGRDARNAAGPGDRAPGWPGWRPGACGPRAIRGREADASPESSSRPGFRQAAGRP
jgi:hypothetical protein